MAIADIGRRVMTITGITAGLTIAGTGLFGSAQAVGITPLNPHALGAAVTAAHSAQGTGLVREAVRAALLRQDHARMAPAVTGRPRIAARGVAVYGLSPDFVGGRSHTPGRLWYVATRASLDGTVVTVDTAREHGRWSAVNVATGDTEARMAHRVGRGVLLVEPQVDAWYAVRGGLVRPLNAAARHVIGAGSVPIARYQRIVAHRYADKQAGSAYDHAGAAGGYDDASSVVPAPRSTRSRSVLTADTWMGGGVAAAAAGAGVMLVRRRQARA